MKILIYSMALLVGAMLWPDTAAAQTTTPSTTFQVALSATGSQVVLASSAGVSAGSFLFSGLEGMQVVSSAGGAVWNVVRGTVGSPQPHAAGSTVYTAPIGQGTYVRLDPGPGSCTAANYFSLPLVNIANGNVWNCTAGAWTIQGGGTGATSFAQLTGQATLPQLPTIPFSQLSGVDAAGAATAAQAAAIAASDAAGAAAAVLATSVQKATANTYTGGGLQDLGNVSLRPPNGTLAALPASCVVWQTYIANDQALGATLYECTATNVWSPLSTVAATANAGVVRDGSGGVAAVNVTATGTVQGQSLTAAGAATGKVNLCSSVSAATCITIAPNSDPTLSATYGLSNTSANGNDQFVLRSGVGLAYTDTGAANAYVATIGNYNGNQAGEWLFLKIGAGNTNTGASTLNVNGLGAVAIQKWGNQALSGGELPAGINVLLRYDGASFQIVSASYNINIPDVRFVLYNTANPTFTLTPNVAQLTAARTITYPDAGGVLPVGSINTVTLSATPAFTPINGTTQKLVLGATAVTSYTVANGTANGQHFCFEFVQDATGSRTLPAAPANLRGMFTIGATASKANVQCFTWDTALTAWLAESLGSTNE